MQRYKYGKLYLELCSPRGWCWKGSGVAVKVLERFNLIQNNLAFESIVVAILKDCLIPSNESSRCSVVSL